MLFSTARYFSIYFLDLFILISYSYLIPKKIRRSVPDQSFAPSLTITSHALRAYMLMIRKFTLLCKLNSIKDSDFRIFKNAQDSITISAEVCPTCGAKHLCSFHASYERDMIVIENNSAVCHNVSISRVICSSCGHTHALLPDILIPFGSYSLFFILKVLRSYYLHSYTSEMLCSIYSISISTLYTWIHLLNKHKALWLGVLSDLENSALSFLNLLMDNASFPMTFFREFHFSFLQHYRFTTVSHLP